MAFIGDIPLKKKYGQHFLRQQSIVDAMVAKVSPHQESCIFEIGCGDGFLTSAIMQQKLKKLWVFEIDHDWAEYVKKKITDNRLTVFEANILDQDFSIFEADKPWVLLANLPYQITFPILHLLQRNRHLIKEGVVMVQEEVAQKIVKTGGKDYGHASLFFQYYFEWHLMDKISPSAFFPPPKVHSRLLYFKPHTNMRPIPQEEDFWIFIKRCFKQPRRTLRNNLMQTHFDMKKIPEQYLELRAQQMKFDELVHLWESLQSK